MKTLLKIIDKIAKKQGSDIFEVFAVYLANLTSWYDKFEKITSTIFDLNELNEKEIEALKNFFEMLKNEDLHEDFVEDMSKFIEDEKEVAKKLAMYFVTFLPPDALESQDAEKIRESLKHYPQEISEIIIKALESLSIVEIDEIDKKYKREILKNVIKMIVILYQVMKILGEKNESF